MNIVTEVMSNVKTQIDLRVRLTLLSRRGSPRKGRPTAYAVQLSALWREDGRIIDDLDHAQLIEAWQYRLLYDTLQPERDYDNQLLRYAIFYGRIPGDAHHGQRKWHAEETLWLAPAQLPDAARRAVGEWLAVAAADPLTRAAINAGYGYEDEPGRADVDGFVYDAADKLVRSLNLPAYEDTPDVYRMAREYIRAAGGDVDDARADVVMMLEVEDDAH